MNVTINRAEMLSAIKRASAIAPADSPLDVLRGVLLEADAAAGKLTVTSTNLEAALEEKLPCTVQEDGALVFGAKMLAEMLSRLPQDTVQLCRAENQGRMTLRSGDACYEVDVWERGAFPKPDLPFPEDTVKLSGIPAMAQHTVFATAQDNSKPLLKCVNLMFTSTGLCAAGSNGNCIVTARGDNQSTGDVSLLIPAASLGKLSNMCQDKDEFRVGTTGKSIVFFRENFLFSARLMEGRLHRYGSVGRQHPECVYRADGYSRHESGALVRPKHWHRKPGEAELSGSAPCIPMRRRLRQRIGTH